MMPEPGIDPMPPDAWYVERDYGDILRLPLGFEYYESAVGTNGHIYAIPQSHTHIRVQSLTNGLITNISCNGWMPADVFAFPHSIAIDTNGLAYVTLSGEEDTNEVVVFRNFGELVRRWGSTGDGEGQFNRPSGIALIPSNLVAVADGENCNIQVFTREGAFVRRWGERGTLPGQFRGSHDVSLAYNPVDGYLYACEGALVQVFETDGAFVRSLGEYDPGRRQLLASPDRLLLGDTSLNYWGEPLRGLGCTIYGLPMPGSGTPDLLLPLPDHSLYTHSTLFSHSFAHVKRGYRTMTPADDPNEALPLAAVLAAAQRSTNMLVDVDFHVTDQDDTHVHVEALAFDGGGRDIASVVPMRTFEEGTHTNRGPGVPVGETHRLTWNAGADISNTVTELQVEILCKDDRDMLGMHLITIPSNGPSPELTMNRCPVFHEDLLSVWFWLLATNDSEIEKRGHEIFGTTGGYSNVLLAAGVETTSNGVDFVSGRLSCRRATQAEYQRAMEASTPGTITRDVPVTRVGIVPWVVNEYGFDSGDYGDELVETFWLVPLP